MSAKGYVLRLLITDLDNTLYDWVTYFGRSFAAMVPVLEQLLETPGDQLLREFKVVHQRYGDSETPFATLELASVRRRYGDVSRLELQQKLSPAFEAFNAVRRSSLVLYPGVASTLKELRGRGIVIVGHTEASDINAINRLVRLNIHTHFKHLFALESTHPPHPDPNHTDENSDLARSLVRRVPRSERKPNPDLLLDICRQEEVDPRDAYYIGDSLTRDISMANACATHSVWARYGTVYDPSHWQTLVAITHWTDDDVRREGELKSRLKDVQPEFVVDSFAELLRLIPKSQDH